MFYSITLGGFGVDRFYLGLWKSGIGKLFSFGGFGIWTIIDIVLIGVGYFQQELRDEKKRPISLEFQTNALLFAEICSYANRCNWTNGYSWSKAMFYSITLGGFGVDRFYLGLWKSGIGKLFSFGGFGIWTIIDIVLIGVGYVGPADGSLYI
uniref:TM2 domain-containing protein n=1 Tax=Ditylenchus dipsaci TaxID=166011 RepID=A0A915DYP9_9BILA